MNKSNNDVNRIVFVFNKDSLEITELSLNLNSFRGIVTEYISIRNKPLVNGAIYWSNFSNKFYKLKDGRFLNMETVSVPEVIRAWCLATGKPMEN